MTPGPQPDFNPYDAPRSDGRGPTDYFRLVGTRVRYAEYWRMSPNPLVFFILAARKTLRLPSPIKSAVCYPHRLCVVEPDRIPDHIRSIWAEPFAEAERLGYRLQFCYFVPKLGVTKESLTAVLLSPDARIFATLSYMQIHVKSAVKEFVYISAGSRLADDRRLSTTNTRATFDPAPGAAINSVPRRRKLLEVVEAHQEWLLARGWEPRPIPEADLADVLHRRETLVMDHLIRRGVYRRMTEREVEAYSRAGRRANALALTAADRRFFRILGGAERLVVFTLLAGMACAWSVPSGRSALLLELVMILALVGLFALLGVRSAKTRAVAKRG